MPNPFATTELATEPTPRPKPQRMRDLEDRLYDNPGMTAAEIAAAGVVPGNPFTTSPEERAATALEARTAAGVVTATDGRYRLTQAAWRDMAVTRIRHGESPVPAWVNVERVQHSAPEPAAGKPAYQEPTAEPVCTHECTPEPDPVTVNQALQSEPVTPIGVKLAKPATGSRQPPRPKVPTREPSSQNEHLLRIFGSHDLREYPAAQHVAMALHAHMGAQHKKQFGRPTKATASYLHEVTGLTEKTCRTAITHAVERGFYRRIDDASGGKAGKGGAVYVPTVPDYTSTR